MAQTSRETAVGRRAVLGAMGAGALAGLTGCVGGISSGTPQVTFLQSKPEAISYFGDLLDTFRAEYPGSLSLVHNTNVMSLSASFARSNPPDLGCQNYNLEMARFQERGALSDLSEVAGRANITPAIQDLVDQYPTYPGRTSVISYSMMGAAVLYNREIFADHDLEVPTTYTEFLEVCDTLQEAGVTPLYSTFRDTWTIAQGLVDYSVGGSIDVADFFSRLRALGPDVGPDAEVSFSRDFREPLEKMLTIASYSQPGAASRGYGDGNHAFAGGEAAMYFQGPWALAEIEKTNPDAPIGIFPLPMTEDPADRKVRVNLDLALWIPEQASAPEPAHELLEFLIQPEIADPYNEALNGFGVRTDAPPAEDPRLQDIQGYIDGARFYQGVSTGIPKTIPYENYFQAVVLGQDLESTLRTLDEDWARRARR